jgi:REP element-mobilizing transposase RayT
LADALPQERLASWQSELAHLPQDTATRERSRRIEAYLDSGKGVCLLRNPPIARIVQEAFLHFQGIRYHLHAWVIMPNHVHILFTPAPGTALSDIVQAWKSFTAKKVNHMLRRTGVLWQADYFDRLIRDERHFHTAMTYIENNPVRAGLCTQVNQWPWSSASKHWTAHPGVPRASAEQQAISTGSAGVSLPLIYGKSIVP